MSKSKERAVIEDVIPKRYVRYGEGAKLYSMSENKFQTVAKRANACYKIDRMVLVNCDEFEDYLKQNYKMMTNANAKGGE
ncbi:MAG: transcriptional regulator [Eubacterium sp.]|nr:transcriptional regulator [Eubacterium sp.]